MNTTKYLYRCDGSFNTLDDTSGTACVPNEAEDIKLTVLITKNIEENISCICK